MCRGEHCTFESNMLRIVLHVFVTLILLVVERNGGHGRIRKFEFIVGHKLTFCSFHRIEQNICLVGTSINKGCAVYYYSVVMHGLRIIRYL